MTTLTIAMHETDQICREARRVLRRISVDNCKTRRSSRKLVEITTRLPAKQ